MKTFNIVIIMFFLIFFSGVFLGVALQTHQIQKDMEKNNIHFCEGDGSFSSLPSPFYIPNSNDFQKFYIEKQTQKD